MEGVKFLRWILKNHSFFNYYRHHPPVEAMTSLIVDGRKIANRIKKEVSSEIKKLESKYGSTPTIATMSIGNSKESELYLKLRDKASYEVGIESRHYRFPEEVSEREIIELIDNLNNDQVIHGIMLQQPVPKHLSLYNLLSLVDPRKDVEGLTPFNLGSLMMGEERIVPCTPLAVLKVLEHEKVELKSRDVVIVNHSPVVGKPLAALMLNRNATVKVCHVYTKDLKQYTRNADVLVTAAGVPGLIRGSHVKEDAVVVDVGITKTFNGVKGDVDFDEVKKVAGVITPVPGGVGPVTVACFLENMLKTYRNCVEEKR